MTCCANTTSDTSVVYFSPLKLRPFVEVARDAGVDVEAVLTAQGTSLAEMLHPETRLPRLHCVAIVRALIAPLHDPLIGLRAAERSQLEDIDVLGHLARQCPNAWVALEKLREFTRFGGRCVRARLRACARAGDHSIGVVGRAHFDP